MSLGGCEACIVAPFAGSGWTTHLQESLNNVLCFEELTFGRFDF